MDLDTNANCSSWIRNNKTNPLQNVEKTYKRNI